MAQVIVAGTMDFAGGDVCAEIIRGAAVPIGESRKENGCIAYDWAADPLVPRRLHVFESWKSEASLGAHFGHSSYREMVAYLETHEMIGFAVSLYSVAGVEAIFTEDGRQRDAIFGVKIG